jgi:hypothetical protein
VLVFCNPGPPCYQTTPPPETNKHVKSQKDTGLVRGAQSDKSSYMSASLMGLQTKSDSFQVKV